jgi:hypothetical protein
MKCRLTLHATDHDKDPLRTKEVIGFCDHEPIEGQPFRMHAAPLDPDAHIRMIDTSVIQERDASDNGHKIEFRTENSNYTWEFLGFGN